MAGKLVRYQRAGDLHFVTFSCYQRLPLLSTAPVRELFEQSLETMRARYGLVVTGYVVKPEHVHILLSEPKLCGLDKAIQALKLSVAVRLGKGRFWQARYYDFNVFTSRKVVEKLRYMHRNPVERGLAAEPGDWAWSSFPSLFHGGDEDGRDRVSMDGDEERTGRIRNPRLKRETWGTRF